MGRTACTEPQCLYKGELYLYLLHTNYSCSYIWFHAIGLLQFAATAPYQCLLTLCFVLSYTGIRNSISAHRYEGNSISKLQIVIEKNRMEIMTYKQHLFFNIISIQISTLVPPFHKSLETCGEKLFWLLSEPRAHCSFNRRMFVFDTCPPFRELLHPIMDCLTWQAMFTVHGQHFFVDILCFHIFCP